MPARWLSAKMHEQFTICITFPLLTTFCLDFSLVHVAIALYVIIFKSLIPQKRSYE